jgi:DNA-binding response OmpR family regulator
MPDTFRVVALSRALLSTGLLPSLAFSSTEVLTYLTVDEFSVLVLHMAIVGPTPRAFLGRARASSRAPVLYVGSSPRHNVGADDLDADGHAPDGLPPDTIAAMALSLVPEAVAPARILRWGQLRMDVGRREAWWAARRLVLTSMQFRLLATLVLAEGCVVPALELSRRAFGSAVAHDDERVHAHVRRIRKLIEDDPSHPQFLVTVRGEGFRLAVGDGHASWSESSTPGWAQARDSSTARSSTYSPADQPL